jgi:hypothetical protein
MVRDQFLALKEEYLVKSNQKSVQKLKFKLLIVNQQLQKMSYILL